jgi:hypothetical protein
MREKGRFCAKAEHEKGWSAPLFADVRHLTFDLGRNPK